MNDTYSRTPANHHPAAFCRQIVMKLIDDVIQLKHGKYNDATASAFRRIDVVRNYDDLRQQVATSTCTALKVATTSCSGHFNIHGFRLEMTLTQLETTKMATTKLIKTQLTFNATYNIRSSSSIWNISQVFRLLQWK